VNNTLNKLFQGYERMNVADALVTRQYNDADVIIRQVRADGLCIVTTSV